MAGICGSSISVDIVNGALTSGATDTIELDKDDGVMIVAGEQLSCWTLGGPASISDGDFTSA